MSKKTAGWKTNRWVRRNGLNSPRQSIFCPSTVFPFPKSQSWAESATIRHIRQGMYRSILSMINCRQVGKSGGLVGHFAVDIKFVTNPVALSLKKNIDIVGLSLPGSSQKHHDCHYLSLSYTIFIIIGSIFKPNVLVLLRQGGFTACLLSMFRCFLSVDVVSRLLIFVCCSLFGVGCR
jgi:hypothetical protein